MLVDLENKNSYEFIRSEISQNRFGALLNEQRAIGCGLWFVSYTFCEFENCKFKVASFNERVVLNIDWIWIVLDTTYIKHYHRNNIIYKWANRCDIGMEGKIFLRFVQMEMVAIACAVHSFISPCEFCGHFHSKTSCFIYSDKFNYTVSQWNIPAFKINIVL